VRAERRNLQSHWSPRAALSLARVLTGKVLDSLIWQISPKSYKFWDCHYRLGGTSGPGSAGLSARYKAEFVNTFIRDHKIETVTDFGCGDGAQLSLLKCPAYVGLDVSRHALNLCIQRFKLDESKSFFLYSPQLFVDNKGVFISDAALSMDVIFHLVENEVFECYMDQLFSSARKFVIIYSNDSNDSTREPRYTRSRKFTDWVISHRGEWQLSDKPINPYAHLTNTSFYVYSRVSE
jgi:hypothetical protein